MIKLAYYGQHILSRTKMICMNSRNFFNTSQIRSFMPYYLICFVFLNIFWNSDMGGWVHQTPQLIAQCRPCFIKVSSLVFIHSLILLLTPLYPTFLPLHPQATILIESMCFCLFEYAFTKCKLYNVQIF